MVSSSPSSPDFNFPDDLDIPGDLNTPIESLSEQQMLLFWYVARILLRLSGRINWAELDQAQKPRYKRLLKDLSQEIHTARRTIKSKKPPADQVEPLG